jgi:hypothetical protein
MEPTAKNQTLYKVKLHVDSTQRLLFKLAHGNWRFVAAQPLCINLTQLGYTRLGEAPNDLDGARVVFYTKESA